MTKFATAVLVFFVSISAILVLVDSVGDNPMDPIAALRKISNISPACKNAIKGEVMTVVSSLMKGGGKGVGSGMQEKLANLMANLQKACPKGAEIFQEVIQKFAGRMMGGK